MTSNASPVPGISSVNEYDWPTIAGAGAAAVLLKEHERTETTEDGKKTVRFSVVSDEARVEMAKSVAGAVNAAVLSHNAIAEQQAAAQSEDTESDEDEELEDLEDDEDE